MMLMRALFRREAGRIADVGAFHAALVAQAAGVTAFLTLWGQGVGAPLIAGMTLYDQLQLVQWSIAACLLPWCAARCVGPERADRAIHMTARLGVRPSRWLTARVLALATALALVTAAGLPIVVLAQRMSDVAVGSMLADQAELVAFAAVVAAAVTALQQALASRLVVWLAATACGLALLEAARVLQLSGSGRGISALVVAALTAILLARRGDLSLRYLSERAA